MFALMLREFWFPVVLTLASVLPGFAVMQTDGNARWVFWIITGALWFAAFLAYEWGDPVRGPFYKLTHPRSKDTFRLHAGVAVGFPVKDLKNGIDFSRAVSLPGQPIELWVQRTWWTGWRYRFGIKSAPDSYVVKLTNEAVETLPHAWDVNSDDYALEIVGENRLPRVQIIQAGDYDVYLNTVLAGPKQAIVFKDNRLALKPTDQLTVADFPDPIFRYPSYAFKGARR